MKLYNKKKKEKNKISFISFTPSGAYIVISEMKFGASALDIYAHQEE